MSSSCPRDIKNNHPEPAATHASTTSSLARPLGTLYLYPCRRSLPFWAGTGHFSDRKIEEGNRDFVYNFSASLYSQQTAAFHFVILHAQIPIR